MVADTIREMLDRDPFEAFRVVTSSGESYPIRDPHLVALLKSEVFIAHPNSDRRSYVQVRNITSVETHTNGRVKTRRKRRA